MAWQYNLLLGIHTLVDKVDEKIKFRIEYVPSARVNDIPPTQEMPHPFCCIMPNFGMPLELYKLRLDKDGLTKKVSSSISQDIQGYTMVGTRKLPLSKLTKVKTRNIGYGNYDDFIEMINYANSRFIAIQDEVIANTKIKTAKRFPMPLNQVLAPKKPIDKINWRDVYFSILTSFKYRMNQAIAASFDARDLRVLTPEQATELTKMLR